MSYRRLLAWQKSVALCTEIYRVTRGFPEDEKFGLISQLRRASVSVPSNIAEGYGRRTRPEFERFLTVSLGSVREIETQIIIAGKLKLADAADLRSLLRNAEEIAKIINGLLRKPD